MTGGVLRICRICHRALVRREQGYLLAAATKSGEHQAVEYWLCATDKGLVDLFVKTVQVREERPRKAS